MRRRSDRDAELKTNLELPFAVGRDLVSHGRLDPPWTGDLPQVSFTVEAADASTIFAKAEKNA